jgi:hypothetical protein
MHCAAVSNNWICCEYLRKINDESTSVFVLWKPFFAQKFIVGDFFCFWKSSLRHPNCSVPLSMAERNHYYRPLPNAFPRCVFTMRFHDAFSRCVFTMRFHDAFSQCVFTMRFHNAFSRCVSTMRFSNFNFFNLFFCIHVSFLLLHILLYDSSTTKL